MEHVALIYRLASVLRLPRGYVRRRMFEPTVQALGESCRVRSEAEGRSYEKLFVASIDLANALSKMPGKLRPRSMAEQDADEI